MKNWQKPFNERKLTSNDVQGKFMYSDDLKKQAASFCYKRRALYLNCRSKWKHRSDGWSIEKDVGYVINSVKIYDTRYALLLERYHTINGKLFLDIGCGWGPFEISLAMRHGEVVGIEIDRDAIGLGKRLAREHRLQDRVHFIVADARKLPFIAEAFDGVVSFGAFEHILMAELAIEEGWRALRNKGIFYFETPNRLFPFDSHDTNLFFIHWLPACIANPIAYAFHRIDPSNMRQNIRNMFELNRFLTYRGTLKVIGSEAEIVSYVEKTLSNNAVANRQGQKLEHNLGTPLLVFFKRICDLLNISAIPFLPVLKVIAFKKKRVKKLGND